jgi:hypothetical protein
MLEKNDFIPIEIFVEKVTRIKDWERLNLPTYGTSCGYDLFLRLAALTSARPSSMKHIYLSSQCAESTTRKLLRYMEEDGWILLPNSQNDLRFREILLTEKFQSVVVAWENFVVATWGQ